MSRPKSPLPASKHLVVEKEMSEIGQVRRVPFGLAAKFTAPVSVALSLLIMAMGYVVYSSTAAALENEINKSGVFAARLAAAPEIDSWDPGYNTVQDLQRRIAEIDAAMAIAGGASTTNTPDAVSTEEQRRLRQLIESHDTAQRGFNRRRLAALLSEAALDVWIVAGEDQLEASASGRAKLAFTQDRHFVIEDAPEIRIATGVYHRNADASDVGEAARFFTAPIKDRNAKVVGRATVVVSERGLRADLAGQKNRLLLFCVLGVLGVGLIAFVSSRIITRPLVSLLDDVRAVAEGDLAHRTRVRSGDEIGAIAHAFDEMTKNLARAEVMRMSLAEKEHQVSIASEVQERLFPKQLPDSPGLVIDARNRLASDLSSDLFDVVQLEDGRIGVLVMTSSGRGIPAVIVLSMARAIFRSRAVLTPSPIEALRTVNALLAPDLRRGLYVSALYAVIDPATGAGSLASAGQRMPALHFVLASGGLRRIQTSGIAMGLDKGPVFDRSLTEAQFQLAPGDRLVVSTEGILHLTDTSGEALGEDQVLKLVLGACKKGASAEAILAAVAARLGPAPGDHDVTLVTATRS